MKLNNPAVFRLLSAWILKILSGTVWFELLCMAWSITSFQINERYLRITWTWQLLSSLDKADFYYLTSIYWTACYSYSIGFFYNLHNRKRHLRYSQSLTYDTCYSCYSRLLTMLHLYQMFVYILYYLKQHALHMRLHVLLVNILVITVS